jgi:hypothetical protein
MEGRATALEASTAEIRANMQFDHQQMVINIHDNNVMAIRNKE